VVGPPIVTVLDRLYEHTIPRVPSISCPPLWVFYIQLRETVTCPPYGRSTSTITPSPTTGCAVKVVYASPAAIWGTQPRYLGPT
jgi:hypothetical protein